MDVLNIKNPIMLFNKDNPKKSYLDLVAKYHPDRTGGNSDIMSHINDLWVVYQEYQKSKYFDKEILTILSENYYKSFIYQDKVKFVGITDFSKFSIPDFSVFKDNKLEKEFRRLLPTKIIRNNSENSITINYPNSGNLVPLQLVLNQYSGSLNSNTVAWVVGCMLNLSCYFHLLQIHYGGFIIKNLWIDPKEHMIVPIGGWWCCTKYSSGFTILDKEVVDIFKTKDIKHPAPGFDVKIIKHTAKRLLGNYMPYKLKTLVPEPMFNWLNSGSCSDPIQSYTEWDKVLSDSFGVRKFVELPYNIFEGYNIPLTFNT